MLPAVEDICSHQEHLKTFLHEGFHYTCVGAPGHEPESPLNEARRAARLIYDRAAEPLHLAISGGLDSECMLEAFQSEKIPFTCAILRFQGGYNEHDITTAVEICQARGLSFYFVDFDWLDFYESGRYARYARDYKTNSPQFAAHCWFLERIQGPPVLSGDFYYFHHDFVNFHLKPNAIRVPDYKEYCLDRCLKSAARFGVSHFFSYTPELIYSFLLHTRAGRSPDFDNSALKTKYDFKQQVYRDGGFSFGSYPNRTGKFTGFEKIKAVFAERHADPLAFENLYRLPLERLRPAPQGSRLLVKKHPAIQPVLETLRGLHL